MAFRVEVFGNLITVCCLILRFFGEIITVFYSVILGRLVRCLSDYDVWGWGFVGFFTMFEKGLSFVWCCFVKSY